MQRFPASRPTTRMWRRRARRLLRGPRPGHDAGATLDAIIDAGHGGGRGWADAGPAMDGRGCGAAHCTGGRDRPRPRRRAARLQELYDVIGATLAISESVPAAFGVLALAGGDLRQTAIYAAALSGDADTIGAMACAIAGAWRGAGLFCRSGCPADGGQPGAGFCGDSHRVGADRNAICRLSTGGPPSSR